jgi:hypothetical protein
MTHRSDPRFITHLPLMCLLVLALACPVSAEWKEKVLYSFQGGANDGSFPAGGVVFDSKGNLYGATTYGGLTACAIGGECGTVFQLSPPVHKGDPWNETVIYQFRGQGVNDGGVPSGGLIIDAAGNLYGITAYGGSGDCVLLGLRAGCGTVYELSPPKQKGGAWKETILYSFPTAKQGYFPNGNLVFEKSGNLYGATTFGGTKGTSCDAYYGGQCGVVFELTPPKAKPGRWTEQVLHNFAGGTDGANPNGGLVLDRNGAIYGTTSIGGNQLCDFGGGNVGCGVVFELVPPREMGKIWEEKLLHRFTDGDDGAIPNGGMIFDEQGRLYGTTGGGGSGNKRGVVFRLVHSPTSRWGLTTLHSFQGSDGWDPVGPVARDAAGNIYGTTNAGGPYFGGNIFQLKPPLEPARKWSFFVLYNFTGPPDAEFPAAQLIFGKNSTLLSTTQNGGAGQACQGGCGTVFEFWP